MAKSSKLVAIKGGKVLLVRRRRDHFRAVANGSTKPIKTASEERSGRNYRSSSWDVFVSGKK
jgi:hypothetical protein